MFWLRTEHGWRIAAAMERAARPDVAFAIGSRAHFVMRFRRQIGRSALTASNALQATAFAAARWQVASGSKRALRPAGLGRSRHSSESAPTGPIFYLLDSPLLPRYRCRAHQREPSL